MKGRFRNFLGALMSAIALLLVPVVVVVPVVTMTGCTHSQVVKGVQDAVTVLASIQAQIPAAKSLGQTIAAVDPGLGNAIVEYSGSFDASLTQVIKLGNAYLASPTATGFQGFLNAVDALTAAVDSQVLAAAHIVNPQSQQKVQLFIGVIATSLHLALGIVQGVASAKQQAAMPKLANAVPMDVIRPYLRPDLARAQLVQMGYNADSALSAAGF